MRVDSARDAICDLDVQFGDNVFCARRWSLGQPDETTENAPGYTLASLISRTAALSTMLRTVKRLIALSLATHREQLEQRTNPTWPRPFLLRPPFLLFLVCRMYRMSREESEKERPGTASSHPTCCPSITPDRRFLAFDGSWRRSVSPLHVGDGAYHVAESGCLDGSHSLCLVRGLRPSTLGIPRYNSHGRM